MARKAEQGALQYAASVTEVNPPRIGGAGFISGVFNDFLANPRLPFNRLTPIGRWLGYFWDSKVAPLALNFADGTNTLDSRITFSRSSNATVTDSNGNIVYAPHNLVTFSEQFDNSAWTKAGATISANASVSPNGETTADKIAEDSTTGSHSVTQGVPNLNVQNCYSWFAKAAERTKVVFTGGGFTAQGFTATFNLSNGTMDSNVGSRAAITAVGNGWYRCSVTFTPSNTTAYSILIADASGNTTYTGTTGSGVLIWGAQLNVGSLQPYYPTTVKNLLGFSEAFDNAAWTKSNSFIQTNLLTFSEQFDNAAWSKTNVSVTANNTLSPFGTSTADTIIPNTTSGDHLVAAGSIAATSGTVYTLSVYAKASGYNFIRLSFGNVAGGGYTFFDLNNGTVGTTSSMTSSSITPVGNGWYRCSVTRAASSTANLGGDVYITSANGQFNWSGNGTSGVALWGAQLVQGASAGDYVQTTSAALPVMYQAPNGTMTADKLVETAVNGGHYPANASVTLVANTPVTVSCYVKQAEPDRHFSLIHESSALFGGVFPRASFNLSTGVVVTQTSGTASITAVGNGWYRCSLTATPSSSGGAVVQFRMQNNTTLSNPIGPYTGDGTSGVYLWGAQLSDSASLDTYVNNPVAAPSSTAFYGPRFDYDPVTRQPRGLLIEEARTNLVLRSEEFDNASWTKGNSSITANATNAPDGTSTADKLVENTATSTHQLFQGTTKAAAAMLYSCSIYIKAAERTKAFVGLTDFSGNESYAFFDLSNGTVGSVVNSGTFTGGVATVTFVGNGWYRCSITATTSTTTTVALLVRNVEGVSNVVYTGNGTSGLFVWGAQLEAGAFPTSYIPTTTATVTRAADVAVIQGSNFSSWYKYDEGSVYAEFSVARQIAIAGTGIVAMDDGTVNNQNRIFGRGSGATGYGVVFGGVGQADLSPTGVLSANTTAKIATAYQINNFATSGNAGTVQTDTSGSIPTLTIMRIGIDLVSNVYLNGWIRRINYYNRRLDNSQLQAITQ